jgi:hypothetical protein
MTVLVLLSAATGLKPLAGTYHRVPIMAVLRIE